MIKPLLGSCKKRDVAGGDVVGGSGLCGSGESEELGFRCVRSRARVRRGNHAQRVSCESKEGDLLLSGVLGLTRDGGGIKCWVSCDSEVLVLMQTREDQVWVLCKNKEGRKGNGHVVGKGESELNF